MWATEFSTSEPPLQYSRRFAESLPVNIHSRMSRRLLKISIYILLPTSAASVTTAGYFLKLDTATAATTSLLYTAGCFLKLDITGVTSLLEPSTCVHGSAALLSIYCWLLLPLMLDENNT